MAEGSQPRTAALLAALRSGIVSALILALLGLVAGGFVGWSRSDTHVAEATILLNPLDGNPFSTTGRGDDLINMVTEAELIQSDAVALMVQEDLATEESPSSLLRGLEVHVPANSQILAISYEARSVENATTRAQSFAEQYLEYRRQRAISLLTDREDRIATQLEDRRTEQSQIVADLSQAAEGSEEELVLQQKLDAVTAQISQLVSRATEIAATPINPGQIVTSAVVADGGILGSWLVFPAAGLIGGVLLALALVLVRSRLDNRIHTPDDIPIAGHTLVGQVSLTATRSIESALASNPATAGPTDAYRSLRVRILTEEQQRPLVILLATASNQQPNPLTAKALAVTMSTSQLDTVLIDTTGAITPPPSPNRRSKPLAEILSGDGNPLPGLSPLAPQALMIANDDPAKVKDAFMTPQMHRLMTELRGENDIIVLCGGSIHQSHTLALAISCDVVLLEAREGVTTYADLMKTTDELTSISEKLLGIILVTGAPGSTKSQRPRRSGQRGTR